MLLATGLTDMNGSTTGRSIILWSDQSSHNFLSSSGHPFPAATFVNSADLSVYG